MPVNHKLTNVVKDRVVQNFQLAASELLISFVGGSTMMVKIEEFNSPPLREGARIRQISEDQVKLVIECEDGLTFDVRLVDPGSSVAVRDKSDMVEYLGSCGSLFWRSIFFLGGIMGGNGKGRIETTAVPPPWAQQPSHPAAAQQKTFAAVVL
jgi:hypothetical protein